MAPKLREKYPNLPKYVTASNGRIVYRPRVSPDDQLPADKHGYLKPPAKLGKVGDSEYDILQTYLRVKESLDRQSGSQRRTLRWMVGEYRSSKAFTDLSLGTRMCLS